jgi:hypothetical protein
MKVTDAKVLWHVCWKPELWSQQRQMLLGNSSANTPVARQWFSSRHLIVTTEELLEVVFCVRSMPGLYNEGQLPLRNSPEMAITRVGCWCEMAASLRGREPRRRGTSTVGRCYQAAQWRTWLRTLVCVWQWSVKCRHELCVKVFNKSNYQSKPRL